MIYFLYGESSYHALRKIGEFKEAYKKKNKEFLIEEYDGESEEIGFGKFHSALGQANLFAATRLIVFKNLISDSKEFLSELKTNADFLKSSKDVFVFWERDLEAPVLTFFKKYAEKTQEVGETKSAGLDKWLDKKALSLNLKLDKNERTLMIDEAGAGAEWELESELEKIALGSKVRRVVSSAAPNVFSLADRMFGPRALLTLKEMSVAGIEPQKFIYAFLWKLKQRHMQDNYFDGIKAESQMKRDPKNAEEILERFIFSLPDR